MLVSNSLMNLILDFNYRIIILRDNFKIRLFSYFLNRVSVKIIVQKQKSRFIIVFKLKLIIIYIIVLRLECIFYFNEIINYYNTLMLDITLLINF